MPTDTEVIQALKLENDQLKKENARLQEQVEFAKTFHEFAKREINRLEAGMDRVIAFMGDSLENRSVNSLSMERVWHEAIQTRG